MDQVSYGMVTSSLLRQGHYADLLQLYDEMVVCQGAGVLECQYCLVHLMCPWKSRTIVLLALCARALAFWLSIPVGALMCLFM